MDRVRDQAAQAIDREDTAAFMKDKEDTWEWMVGKDGLLSQEVDAYQCQLQPRTISSSPHSPPSKPSRPSCLQTHLQARPPHHNHHDANDFATNTTAAHHVVTHATAPAAVDLHLLADGTSTVAESPPPHAATDIPATPRCSGNGASYHLPSVLGQLVCLRAGSKVVV